MACPRCGPAPPARMLYFASTSSDLDDLDAHPDIGVMTGPRVGGLGSILTSQRPWASDCDALSKHGFHYDEFVEHLRRVHDPELIARCQFVVVPDVPGCGRSTLAAFHAAAPELAELGFPSRTACKTVQRNWSCRPVTWPSWAAVTLAGGGWGSASGTRGGPGLRTHVGRVNSARRVRHLSFCHCDSVDGTYVGFLRRGAGRAGDRVVAAGRGG